jgi:hypothetical protein
MDDACRRTSIRAYASRGITGKVEINGQNDLFNLQIMAAGSAAPSLTHQSLLLSS